MSKQHFIEIPGLWKGEGKMLLTLIPDEIKFTTSWKVLPPDLQGVIRCVQEVKIDCLATSTSNQFSFYPKNGGRYTLDLDTEALGRVSGSCLASGEVLAWELGHKSQGFGGFELYERLQDGSYKMKGEFATGDACRSEVTCQLHLQKA